MVFGFMKRIFNAPTTSETSRAPNAPAQANTVSPSIETSPRPTFTRSAYPIVPMSSFMETAERASPSSSSSSSDTPTAHTSFQAPSAYLQPARVDPLLSTLDRPVFGKAAMHTPPARAFTTVTPSHSFAHLGRNRIATSPPERNFTPPPINRTETSTPVSVDVEMEDATHAQNPTPPETPPTKEQNDETARINTSSSTEEPRAQKSARTPTSAPGVSNRQSEAQPTTSGYQATAEEEQVEELTSTPVTSNHQPTVHQETSGLYMRPDYASEVIIEEFPDPAYPMPKGYYGTWRGVRMQVSTAEGYCECGLGGGHYLICGHTVVSKEPCGSNCKTLQHDNEAFKCQSCGDLVKDILLNKLTAEETAKLTPAKEKNASLFLALAVEAVTRRMPTAKVNIAETVMGPTQDYSRASLLYATVEYPNEPKNFSEMFQYHHESMQNKTRKIIAQMNMDENATREKRKDMGETSSDVENAREATEPTPSNSTNKKRKSQPATPTEPTPSSTRGTKRPSASPSSSSSPCTPTKKCKHRLASHAEPITRNTRGTKRSSSPSPDTFRASKRVEMFSPPKFGIVGFKKAPEMLGLVGRKRDGCEWNGEEEERGRKRYRAEEVGGWDEEEEL